MKKALIIAGKGTQDQEFIYPYYRLKEAGCIVDVAVENRNEEVKTYNGILIPYNLFTSELLKPISLVPKYDLLILPGGAKAMEYIRQDREVIKFIRDFYAYGKIIASICHGAQLLISADIIRGRLISGYYSIRDDINNAGAEYVDAPVVTHGNIITSPHYKYLGDWMREVIKHV